MAQHDISYVIHIASTPDRVWQALTGAVALQQNWGRIHSNWTPGARVEEVSDSGKVLWQGEVVEAKPGRHLSFTFDVVGSGEKPTNVSFDIAAPASATKPNEAVVRLTTTQSGFAEGSKLMPECARAWTEIMSSIKSYVETGKALPFAWKH
jgi:uncharacterized protein YndB with AHSA1/START domain